MPQWSPLSTSGATAAVQPQQPIGRLPQWSPLSTSGATTLADLKDSYVEPVPQWSPLSTSGATDRRTPAGRAPSGAAMEPALDERGDVDVHKTSVMTHPRRNGARSRRAGRPSRPKSMRTSKKEPQWSPLSTSGATRPAGHHRRGGPCRNGARSRRAGRRTGRSTSSATWWGRNGARSRRAGRLGRAGLRADGAAAAAMEPALDERGDYWCDMDDPERQAAAMEPALDERGDLVVVAGHVARPAAAAMEPALDERGDVVGDRPGRPRSSLPQWSPLST